LDWISLLWGFISILILLIAIFLLRLYFIDSDKRKLMYALGLFFSSSSFIILAFGYYQNISDNIIIYNIYRWGGITYVILVFHATFEQLYWRKKDFNSVFNSYLFFNSISFFIIISNLINNDVYILFMILGTITVVINCAGLIIKYRDLSSHLFLFSICSALIGAMILNIIQDGFEGSWNYFSIFAFFISYAFIGLIFGTTVEQESKVPKGIASYFSMQNKLDDVKDSLRNTEEKYRNIVELAPDGIITVDLKGYVTSCNNAFSHITGFSKGEIIAKHITNLPTMRKRDISKYLKLLNSLIRGGAQNVYEFEWVHKDGSVRFAEARAGLLKKNGKITGLQAIIRDITEQKEAEKELKKAHKELQSLNTELEKKVEERTSEIEYLLNQKDEFINQLGHDLKNPLNPLINLLPLLASKVSDEKDKEIFEIIIRNVGYMKSLVIKTIKLAQLNSPSTEFLFEEINLLSEVNNIIASNKLIFDEKNIKVLNKINKDILVSVDVLRFEELLTNLFSNSVKYSKDSGLINIDAKKDGDFVVVSVHDFGVGMKKDQLSQVFDEFYKADVSRHDFESSGLGMPICKRIVERHGGKIWVESPGIGKGTTVYFSLLYKKVESEKNQLDYNDVSKEIDKIIYSN